MYNGGGTISSNIFPAQIMIYLSRLTSTAVRLPLYHVFCLCLVLWTRLHVITSPTTKLQKSILISFSIYMKRRGKRGVGREG